MVRRVPLAAAIAFAVLSVLALVVVPLGPGIERSGAEVVDHVSAHADMIRLRALLTAAALLALVVVIGYVRERLDGPAGYVFTVGAATLVAQVGVELWLTSGMALHASSLDPPTARVLADIASMWGPLLTIAALMLAGPIIWAGRNGRLPHWLAVIAAVFAVEQLVQLLTIIGPPGSFIAPGGPMAVYLGGGLFLVFLFALGVGASQPGVARPTLAGSEPAPVGAKVH
ncbi:MAG: hypothetical protein KIH64_018015 [Mycobacterium sp.]|nr:hypothetical protein [Mycobacterium sp.]